MRLPVLHKSPALQPQELSELTQRAVDELLREGESRNTLASYRSALRYWTAWFAIRYGMPIMLPVPFPAVLQFCADKPWPTAGLATARLIRPDVQDGYHPNLLGEPTNRIANFLGVLKDKCQTLPQP